MHQLLSRKLKHRTNRTLSDSEQRHEVAILAITETNEEACDECWYHGHGPFVGKSMSYQVMQVRYRLVDHAAAGVHLCGHVLIFRSSDSDLCIVSRASGYGACCALAWTPLSPAIERKCSSCLQPGQQQCRTIQTHMSLTNIKGAMSLAWIRTTGNGARNMKLGICSSVNC